MNCFSQYPSLASYTFIQRKVLSSLNLSDSGTEIRIGRNSQCKLCDFSRNSKICFLFEQHQNICSRECCTRKNPSGGMIHICLSLWNGGGDIRKKCWWKTEFLSLLLVVYGMTQYSSIILFPRILFYLPCSWPMSGKEARWNNNKVLYSSCGQEISHSLLKHPLPYVVCRAARHLCSSSC